MPSLSLMNDCSLPDHSHSTIHCFLICGDFTIQTHSIPKLSPVYPTVSEAMTSKAHCDVWAMRMPPPPLRHIET